MRRTKGRNLQDQDNMYLRQGYLSWEGISSPSIETQGAGQLPGLKGRA